MIVWLPCLPYVAGRELTCAICSKWDHTWWEESWHARSVASEIIRDGKRVDMRDLYQVRLYVAGRELTCAICTKWDYTWREESWHARSVASEIIRGWKRVDMRDLYQVRSYVAGRELTCAICTKWDRSKSKHSHQKKRRPITAVDMGTTSFKIRTNKKKLDQI